MADARSTIMAAVQDLRAAHCFSPDAKHTLTNAIEALLDAADMEKRALVEDDPIVAAVERAQRQYGIKPHIRSWLASLVDAEESGQASKRTPPPWGDLRERCDSWAHVEAVCKKEALVNPA